MNLNTLVFFGEFGPSNSKHVKVIVEFFNGVMLMVDGITELLNKHKNK